MAGKAMIGKVGEFNQDTESFQSCLERLEQFLSQAEGGTPDRSDSLKKTLVLNGVPCEFIVDTGAVISVMPINTFQTKFKDKLPKLTPSIVMLSTYTGNKISVVGEFQAQVLTDDGPHSLPMVVVDSVHPNQSTLLGRNWLKKIHIDWSQLMNQDDHSPVAKMATMPLALQETGSLPAMPNETNEKCQQLLRNMLKQLEDVIAHTSDSHGRQMPPLGNLEELTDPAARPFLCISAWVDYSDKYGFGYQLCDGSVGVMFKDQTQILLLANHKEVHYIERTGEEKFHYTMNSIPVDVKNKLKLLVFLRRYMPDQMLKAGPWQASKGTDSPSTDRPTRMPYLYAWKRSSRSIIMVLTNGTVQVNFMNYTKIVICPLMSAVTYIDEDKKLQTFRFSTLEQYIAQAQFSRLSVCLQYIHEKITEILVS